MVKTMLEHPARAGRAIFISIDPGLSGAVAAITEDGQIVSLQDTPTLAVRKGKGTKNTYVESAMASILSGLKDAADGLPTGVPGRRGGGRATGILVTIENVHSMPHQGVSSSFSFGCGFGLWLGICAALRLPIQRVEPAVWKRTMGLAAGADKNASVVLASRLFPTASLERKKDHGRAEALLLAEWARRKASVLTVG